MNSALATDVTNLLQRINDGQIVAWDKLLRAVYHELRVVAAAKLRSERSDHSIQTTDLVNEAFVRLISSDKPCTFQNKRHFFNAAAESMRRILVDAARRRSAAKRNSGRVRQEIGIEELPSPIASLELIALHDALDSLASIRPDIAELVTLRYFAGFTIREAADCMGISLRTANNYWAYAKVYLLKQIEKDGW